MAICSIAGCTREAEVNGMCCTHFTAALVHGALHPRHNHTQRAQAQTPAPTA